MIPGALKALPVSGCGRVVLLPIESADDLELLRLWKNANRDSFFFKGLLSPDDQAAWFEGFSTRPDDFMFVVVADGRKVGCMGFRKLEDLVDVYNVIRGSPVQPGRGVMGRALTAMLRFASRAYHLPVTARVLKSNPATQWYLRNDFEVIETADDHFVLRWREQDSADASCAWSSPGDRG
ncbi:MAG: hypothetical protein A2133_02070 [Actinobacteria bacterium RBG_16_64_13]|nr:MAG: hypothetical protein A2133_02070 [Actinobacteria bacterium RBG_16_64_13]